MQRFSVNDWVIYHSLEASTRPAPGAHDVQPSEHGDLYTYVVDHWWRVARVNADGSIVAICAAGKTHAIRANDPQAQKAGWWQRLLMRRHTFPKP